MAQANASKIRCGFWRVVRALHSQPYMASLPLAKDALQNPHLKVLINSRGPPVFSLLGMTVVLPQRCKFLKFDNAVWVEFVEYIEKSGTVFVFKGTCNAYLVIVAFPIFRRIAGIIFCTEGIVYPKYLKNRRKFGAFRFIHERNEQMFLVWTFHELFIG